MKHVTIEAYERPNSGKVTICVLVDGRRQTTITVPSRYSEGIVTAHLAIPNPTQFVEELRDIALEARRG